jgi:hypothetical protein
VKSAVSVHEGLGGLIGGVIHVKEDDVPVVDPFVVASGVVLWVLVQSGCNRLCCPWGTKSNFIFQNPDGEIGVLVESVGGFKLWAHHC